MLKFLKTIFISILAFQVQVCNAFHVPNQNEEKNVVPVPICNFDCCCQEFQQPCQNCCCCDPGVTNDENNKNNNDEFANNDIYLNNKFTNYGASHSNDKQIDNKAIVYPFGDQHLQNQLREQIKKFGKVYLL